MGYASDWWFWDYEALITLKLQDDILQKCFQPDDTLNEYRAILRDNKEARRFKNQQKSSTPKKPTCTL